MTEGRTRFQVMDGGLRSHIAPSYAQAARPRKESFGLRQVEPCTGDLTTAIRATERRLHALLEDRVRLGRDLHDCVLQSLYAIGINVETARRIRKTQSEEATEADDRVIGQINHLIQEIRGMIRELESGTIPEFDLSLELNTLCLTYEQTGRLHVKLDLQRTALEVLTHEEEREILNIVREALSNCVRHAHATQAVVAIQIKETRIRVSIHDDGMGFSTAVGQSSGYGLANMEARAQKLGGTLRVQSKAGGGTHVMAEFSIEPLLTTV